MLKNECITPQKPPTMQTVTRCGDNVIADMNSATGVVVRTYVTPMLDSNVSMTIAGTTPATYYYNQDERMSVMNLTDGTGAVSQSYGYTAYGDKVDSLTSGTVEQRYTYTGRELSTVSDDYYFRYRWYGAGVGGFMTRDPFRDGYTDGLSMYMGYFAHGLWVDPTGEFTKKDIDKIQKLVCNSKLNSFHTICSCLKKNKLYSHNGIRKTYAVFERDPLNPDKPGRRLADNHIDLAIGGYSSKGNAIYLMNATAKDAAATLVHECTHSAVQPVQDFLEPVWPNPVIADEFLAALASEVFKLENGIRPLKYPPPLRGPGGVLLPNFKKIYEGVKKDYGHKTGKSKYLYKLIKTEVMDEEAIEIKCPCCPVGGAE